MNQLQIYETSDLPLASFLCVVGHKLLSVPNNRQGRKYIFVFQFSKKLEQDILDFYNRTTLVDALSFAEQFRNLKALTV